MQTNEERSPITAETQAKVDNSQPASSRSSSPAPTVVELLQRPPAGNISRATDHEKADHFKRNKLATRTFIKKKRTEASVPEDRSANKSADVAQRPSHTNEEKTATTITNNPAPSDGVKQPTASKGEGQKVHSAKKTVSPVEKIAWAKTAFEHASNSVHPATQKEKQQLKEHTTLIRNLYQEVTDNPNNRKTMNNLNAALRKGNALLKTLNKFTT